MIKKSSFEILCVTMGQNDFSKISEMNIHSNVVFANQCDKTSYDEIVFDESHKAKMFSTTTRGVGINRNIALLNASCDICLFADDDLRYVDDLEQIVLDEFGRFPNADVIIFNLDTDSELRKQKHYSKTRKWHRYEKMPWGAVRVAFRLNSIRKSNVWFTTLFGGGAKYSSGEDSIWLNEIKKKNTIYVSNKTIGIVSMANSSWFSGYDEKFYFAKGAFYANSHRFSFPFFSLYCALRTRAKSSLSFSKRIYWINNGRKGYHDMLSFEEFNKCLE